MVEKYKITNDSTTQRRLKMKPMTVKLSHYFNLITILLVVLLFFNPFNISKYCLIILFIYIFFQLLSRKCINIIFNNKQLWYLVIFCISYTVIQFYYGFIIINTVAVYLLYFLILYIFGMLVVTKASYKGQVVYYLYATIVGLSLFGIIAVVYSNYIYGTSAGLAVRAAAIPWMKGYQLGATGIGMYVSLGIALIGLMFVKTNILAKALNVSIALLSLYASISLANRTGLLIGLSSIVIIYIMQVNLNSVLDNIKIAGSFIFQCIMLFVLFNMNFLDLKTYWLQSNAYNRFINMSLANDPRLMAWGEALRGIFTNPLGGKQAQLSLTYVHNLWLDVAYSAGFLPFIMLIIFTIVTLKCYVRLLHNDNISEYFKYLVTTMICGFVITFMVEPIIEGNHLLFSAFCLFSGVLKAIDKTVKT